VWLPRVLGDRVALSKSNGGKLFAASGVSEGRMSAAIFSAVVLAGCLAALLTAAMIDLKYRIVPNRLVLLIAGGGVALRLLSSPGSIWVSLLVASAFFVVLGRLSHHDWLGGGDAKLITAVTLLAPPAGIGKLLFDITLAGGLMSCVYLTAQFMLARKAASPHRGADARYAMQGGEGLFSQECARIAAGEPMPYALAVLGGVLCFSISEAMECSFAISCSF
jgi:prepilin peptidase CpaA